MVTLQKSAHGLNVKRWQAFLVRGGFILGNVDGDFGPKTHAATRAFQGQNGLGVDGVVGPRTLAKAIELGFEGFVEVAFPTKPDFRALFDDGERHGLFGDFKYKAVPLSNNPENIDILPTWEAENLTLVNVPELRGIRRAPASGNVTFHRLAAVQLKALWAAWGRANLLDRIITFDGAFAPRFVRGSRSKLSNHAFATAFDINAEFNGMGRPPAGVDQPGCLFELVSIAHEHGFFWGGHFDRPDGMHFEIATLP